MKQARFILTVAVLMALASPVANYFRKNMVGPSKLDGTPAPHLEWTVGQSPRKSQLEDWVGKVVILHFWAHWCRPCLAEMPELRKLQSGMDAKLMAVLALHVDTIDARQLRSLPLHDFPDTLIWDFDRKALDDFAISAVPVSILIDKQGIVRHTLYGPQNWQSTPLRSKIIQLMEENPTPTKAANI